MRSRHPGTALATVLAATLLAVTACGAGEQDEQPAEPREPQAEQQVEQPAEAALAADWLTAQLSDGLVRNEQYDFDDHGLSIDVALALRAQGGREAVVQEVAGALEGAVEEYTTGGTEGLYSGAVAKLASFAVQVGDDPTSFGGTDLVERLEGLVSTRPASAGRLQDSAPGTDVANTIGQAFGAHALDAAGSPAAAPATAYLLDQQCAGGWFRLLLTEDPTARDQSCDAGDPEGRSAPDTDATALVVLALLEVDDPSAEITEALQRAQAWLVEQQAADGSLVAEPGAPDPVPSSNSTGLAGWVLGRLGACDEAAAAAQWLAAVQVPEGERAAGAVAYSLEAFESLPASGRIVVPERDQWRRATAQAAPALEHLQAERCGSGSP